MNVRLRVWARGDWRESGAPAYILLSLFHMYALRCGEMADGESLFSDDVIRLSLLRQKETLLIPPFGTFTSSLPQR